MKSLWLPVFLVATSQLAACGGMRNDPDAGDARATSETGATSDADDAVDASSSDAIPDEGADGISNDGPSSDASDASVPCDGSPADCASTWEQNAADRLAGIVGSPTDLAAFLRAMPKGGDLHNHLSGAVYAETYLRWGMADGDCINSSTYGSVYSSQCSVTGNQPIPTSGSFYDSIVRAWSMLDFVPGTETGHDHFFATFGKYGAIAGAHRDDSIADVLTRAADENEVYVETMFNLGTNVGSLSATLWSGTLTTADLPGLYDRILADSTFMTQLNRDLTAVTNAATRYRNNLGCSGTTPPAACNVRNRFIAQVSRTGANDQIFGQLVSAFEMASRNAQIVGANLSSPEDDPTSLRNYDLHMSMLEFLHERYTVTGRSPLHVTLHAGELVPAYLPTGYTDANTFHIRHAVEIAHAERIGHGIDILSETDSNGLLDEMRDQQVLVEVCLSSNDQILGVRGADHPISVYLSHGVPVTLATDDQGVSRSSMAGEFLRAVTDQHFDYAQLKSFARASLEHAFLPGPSLWSSVTTWEPVAACAASATNAVGFDPPSADCQAFLATSDRAQAQWELERRFHAFESAQ